MSGTGASNEARWPRHKDLVAVALHHVACACVRWWVQVLNLKLAERHDWTSCEQSVAHLFGDASGSPPQLGAEHVKAFHHTVALQFGFLAGTVLFLDGQVKWAHMAPGEDTLRHFRRRSDQQIMALELLAISLGLGTFQELLQNRKVVVHCDNTGSEVMYSASTCTRSCIAACSAGRQSSEEAQPFGWITPSWCIRNGYMQPNTA